MNNGPTLFEAEIPDVTNPLPRRRPFPNLPIARATLYALEDTLETHSPDGISWAWSEYASRYVQAKLLLVLSDCRTPDGLTTSVLLNDNPDIDCRNAMNVLSLFTGHARSAKTKAA